tara:strand:- start:147 stop:392 length:246 start_codon:yes stop_codon:yes gene_type:complete
MNKNDIILEESVRKQWGIGHEPDPVVATVMKRMADRSRVGIEKYGCTMLREDIDTVGWIDHAIEELLDAAVYLERLKLNFK